MSMADLERAFGLITDNPGRSFFAGPRDPEVIAAAERALGLSFSPTFRAFVERYGAGNFRSFEIYGVVDRNFEKSMVPDGIWLTLLERREIGLRHNLFIIADTGIGEWYCLEHLPNGEAPVVIVPHGPPFEPYEVVASDFGEFFLTEVQFQMANAPD